MRNLFIFLWDNRFFTLFLILETISVGLLSTSYSYQRSLSYSLTNDISGSLLKTYSDLSDYFYLKEENKQLLEDNANLRNQVAGSFLATDTSTVYLDTLYRFLPARIISITNKMQMNRIIIDKGKIHGIKKEMGVIGKDGIVGIVIGVSDHYSTLMSALSRNANFSAMIKQNGQLVNVSWPGDNYLYGEINDIPSHIQLLEGDTIVSSGNSIIFPKGIIIGYVVEHQKREDKDLSKAKIRFSVDFNKLHHVYIVKNLMKHELDSLIMQTYNE
ncbi:MAG: rod shape-determining protein MreC [Chlorobi bacterium]|nr:rod shape-determining protein MreC [Chlorobiota bacterium]